MVYFNWKFDRLYVMLPDSFGDTDYQDGMTVRVGKFINLCVKRGLKHFAVNPHPQELIGDSFGMIPWCAKLDELILFHDERCWNESHLDKIEFEDVSEEEYYTE
jgi:hypothetical protein